MLLLPFKDSALTTLFKVRGDISDSVNPLQSNIRQLNK